MEVNEAVLTAVKLAGYEKVKIDGRNLVIDVRDPEGENPKIIEAIVKAGGHVQFVNDIHSTLEDVYLKLVRGG